VDFTVLCNQKSLVILHVNALAVGLSLHYNTCTTILTLARKAGTLACCRSLSWTLAFCIIQLLTRGTRAQVHLTSASSEQRWAITNQLLGSRYACSCSDNSMQTRYQKCGSSNMAAKNIPHLPPPHNFKFSGKYLYILCLTFCMIIRQITTFRMTN
jgi:hypothetical protein